MKLCKGCGSPTHANFEYCLACSIEAAEMHVVDWALELRWGRYPPFSLPALAKFYEAHKERFTILGFRYADPCIVKGCQQIETEMPILLAQYKRLPRSPIKKWPQTSKNPHTKHYHESILQLTRQLAELQNGRCAYCGLPLTDDNSTLDTVLPVALSHNRDVATRSSYYQLMALIGNLRVACGRCNFIKGRAESRAVQFMQQLERKEYGVQLALPLLIPKREPREFFNVSALKSCAGVTIPPRMRHTALEQACAVARDAALRVTMPCYHRPKWLLVSWNEQQKHLTFGCPKCADAFKAVWEIAVHTMKWRHGNANGKENGLPGLLNHQELPFPANGKSIAVPVNGSASEGALSAIPQL